MVGFHRYDQRRAGGKGVPVSEDVDNKGLQAGFLPPQAPGRVPQRREDSQQDVARGETPSQRGEEEVKGLYIISVAARLVEMHPQTLRKYERVGLVRPSRTMGMLRLYSHEDLARLRVIKHLVDELRLNLAGVELALQLLDQLMNLSRQLDSPDNEEPEELFDDRLKRIFALLDTSFP